MQFNFPLGQCVGTPAAIEAMKKAGIQAALLLARHGAKDWFELDASDREANAQALIDGSRIFSAYNYPGGVRFYVITEADRSYTTIMLPNEY